MLKRILKIGGIAIGSIILLSIVLTSIFEKKIGDTIVREVQAQMTSTLEVRNFDLSLIRSFPRVSANLEGVIVEDSRGEVLLECEKIAFRFGLFGLLGSNISIRSVILSDGALRVSIDKDGVGNYDIFKEAEEEPDPLEEPSELSLSLKEAILQDIELIYEDESAKQNILTQVEEARFSGEVSSTKFELESSATIFSNFIETETSRFLAGKKVGYDAKVLVDLTEGTYEFQDVTLDLEDNIFRIEGTIDEEPGFTEVDLSATIEEGNLEAVTQFLPADYLDYAGKLTSKGTFYFNATAQGRYNSRTNPTIQVDFGLKEGRITTNKIRGGLKDVNFDASFSNGEKHRNSTSTFVIENFKGFLDNERIEMQLDLKNFDDPEVDFYMDGTLPLRSTYGLLGENVTGGEGELEIKELKVKGRLSDMQRNNRASKIKASGLIEFDDTGVEYNGENLRFDRGELQIKHNLLSIKDLELEGLGSEIVLNGQFNNLLPVIFADQGNSLNAALDFEASLTAKSIDIDRFIALTSAPETSFQEETEESRPQQQEEQFTKSDAEYRKWLASFLDGTFQVKVDEYTSGKIEGENFVGQLIFHDSKMFIKGNTDAMEGNFDLDAIMHFVEEPYIEAKIFAAEINMTEFFRQTENFGQETLTDQNISGTLNSKILIKAFFDNAGNYLADKLYVIAGIGLEDGKLEDFEVLESFSKYVHIGELKEIEFVSLENYLEIEDNVLTIPVMFIQSSALNLTFGGTHTFDNDLDYNLKVNVGQVIFNKVKKYDPNLDPVKAKDGGINLYYKIEGPLDNLNYRSARREIKQDFEQSKYLKRELRQRLIEAFGSVDLIEEPEAWNDIPEHSGFEEGEEDEFLDGDWD